MDSISAILETGNLSALDTNGTGWFIGFSDWCGVGAGKLRLVPADHLVAGLCVKWFEHKAGDPWGQDKPLSEGVTMSILMQEQARFQVDVSTSQGFEPGLDRTREIILEKLGDFAVWGAGLHHRAFGHTDARILTLRWTIRP